MKAMRYLLISLVLITMALSFAGCGRNSGDTENTDTTTIKPQGTTLPEGFELAGEWQDISGQQTKMTITKGEEENAYDVEISWANSPAKDASAKEDAAAGTASENAAAEDAANKKRTAAAEEAANKKRTAAAEEAAETVVWSFSGVFDPVDEYMYYRDCRKTRTTPGAKASAAKKKTAYEDGTGTLSYYDGVLIWQDDEEDAGADWRFAKHK